MVRRRHVIGRTPSTPAAILGSALKAWWCADDYSLMVDDGSGVISSWTDRTGAMAVTAAGSARPTWTATAFLGKPGITFNGTANCFVSTTLTTLPTGSTAGGIMAVLFTADVSGSRAPIAYGGIAGADSRQLRFNANEVPSVQDGTTGTSIGGTGSGLNASIVSGSWSGTSQTGRVNGLASANTGTIASLNTGTTRIRIGAINGNSAGTFWNGVIRHILIYTDATLPQLQALEGWAAWDSGPAPLLVLGHPYRRTRI